MILKRSKRGGAREIKFLLCFFSLFKRPPQKEKHFPPVFLFLVDRFLLASEGENRTRSQNNRGRAEGKTLCCW